MEAQHLSHKLLPGHRQFRGKVYGQGECTALTRHCAAIIQMLVQLEGGSILWTYHKMGLQGQESSHLDTQVRYQSPHPFLVSFTRQDSGSTLPTCQAKLWGKDTACHGRGHIPPPQQGGEEIYPRSVRSFPFPCTRRQQRLTSRTHCHSVPTGKPDGMDDGTMYAIFGLHGITRQSSTCLQSE
jgi:hypothetical protein